jgi:hypothetical protein
MTAATGVVGVSEEDRESNFGNGLSASFSPALYE